MRRVAVALVGVSLVLSGLPASALAQTDPEPEPLGDFVVDDDGLATIDDCDGLGVVPTQIQDAVDTASSGDTIFVCPGLYREQVDVPYPLTLLGAQVGNDPSESPTRLDAAGVGEESIIDADGVERHGIRVEFKDADGTNGDPTVGPVEIDGFTIRNATASGIELRSGDGNRVANNIITGNEQGLYFIGFGEDGTLIEDNIFFDNDAAQNGTGNGIFGGGGGPDRSDNTIIRSNEFSGHSNAGIIFSPPAATGVQITDNDSIGDGIFAGVWSSSSALIADNEILDSEDAGIYLGGGNSDVEVSNNVIDNTPSESCGPSASAAVEVDKFDGFSENSGTLQISSNDLAGHDYGVRVTAGSVASSVGISGNTISHSYCDGISLLDGTGNTVSENQIADNARGMILEAPSAVIENNTFANNSSRHEPGQPDHLDGTGIFGRHGFDGVNISDNSFSGHAQSAITLIGRNASDPTAMTSGVTISSNESSTEDAPDDSLVALFRVAEATVVGNSAEGTSGSSIFLGGGNDDIEITGNSVADATGGAITISEFEDSGNNQTVYCPSRNVAVSDNHLLDSGAGLQILSSSGDGELGDAVEDGCRIPLLEDLAQDAYTGTLSASHNRIVGNTVGVLNNDDDSEVDARNNWWGCNEGPEDETCNDAGGSSETPVQFDPWLVLEVSTDKSTLGPGETATFTADMTNNSDGGDSGGHVPDGTPVAFAINLGSIAPATDVFDSGTASATITNPGVAGTAVAQASVDSETQSSSMTFTGPSVSSSPTDDDDDDDDDGGGGSGGGGGGGGGSSGGGGGGGSGSSGGSDGDSGSGSGSGGSATPSPSPEPTTSPSPETSPSPSPEDDDEVLGRRFVRTRITIGLAGRRFGGAVRSQLRRCTVGRTVALKRKRGGRIVERFEIISRRGQWHILLDRVSPGRWFAVVKVKRFTSRSGRLVTCSRDRSRTILRRR